MKLERFTMGVGDRFGRQGVAQLSAFAKAKGRGLDIVPVWNKSNREHKITRTAPQSVRDEANAAVKALGWNGPYWVDADHIGRETVDPFLKCSDFFTIDVADAIGQAASQSDIDEFVKRHRALIGSLSVPGIERKIDVSEDDVRRIARTFLLAIRRAGEVYRYIVERRSDCSIEVSIDETNSPQTPVDMLVILAAIAEEKIPVQTVAPKFTGRFNKGVDYEGNVAQFTQEFEEDLAVIAYAVSEFGLPENLKLSVHSGSDKFSIYEPIRRAVARFDTGLHIKTAGTTWLEELIGLAEAGSDGLKLAKRVYGEALDRYDELVGPYAAVIDIDTGKLPSADEVQKWASGEYAEALRHIEDNPRYNPHLRQLLHVGYKVAADLGDTYLDALDRHRETIARNVTENILDRHLLPVFAG